MDKHEHTESCLRYRGWIDEQGWHYETWCQRPPENRLMRKDSATRLANPYAS